MLDYGPPTRTARGGHARPCYENAGSRQVEPDDDDRSGQCTGTAGFVSEPQKSRTRTGLASGGNGTMYSFSLRSLMYARTSRSCRRTVKTAGFGKEKRLANQEARSSETSPGQSANTTSRRAVVGAMGLRHAIARGAGWLPLEAKPVPRALGREPSGPAGDRV